MRDQVRQGERERERKGEKVYRNKQTKMNERNGADKMYILFNSNSAVRTYNENF
jgi:hypothetical protein